MRKIGIYNPYLETRGGGEKYTLALAETLAKDKDNQVYLIAHSKIDLEYPGKYFQVDVRNFKLLVINTSSIFLKIIRSLHLPTMTQNLFFDHAALKAIKKEDFDVFINNCYQSNMPAPTKTSVYMCMFPQKLGNKDPRIDIFKKIYLVIMHMLYRLTLHPRNKYAVNTYKYITSNSEFTRHHIKKRWGRDSTVLYPISENMRASNPPDKEKIILNVGRFFENSGQNHHKRQDMLLDAFSELKDLHKDGWQLHFVGSVAEDVGALKYVLKLMKSANGLPVYFHFNSSFKDLRELYNEASIYWHATGIGSDVQKKPERQEHFGISTVEAMSTGCIPVVINSAGQKESVVHGKNGFLWETEKELQDYTKQIASLPVAELKQLQAEAIKDAARFNKTAFNKQIEATFREIFS